MHRPSLRAPLNSAFTFWRENPHGAAIGLIALATLARYFFVASGQLDLVQDEAQYWDWSRHPQLSYYSKGPLIAWVIALFTSIFGDTELGVRFGAILGSLASQLIIYFGIAHLMRKPRLAVITLFILNTMPLFLASGILMTTDNLLLVCWLAALFSLHASVLYPDRLWPMIGFGASLAVGILGKYTMLGMIGVAALHAGMLWRQGLLPEGHCKKILLAFMAGTLLGLLPILAWNAQNDWASFRHVGRLAGVAKAATDAPVSFRPDRVLEYAGGQLGLTYPWWLAFMLYGGGRALSRSLRRQTGFSPREARDTAEYALFSAGFWPIFLFFFAWSFHSRVYANWPGMCYASGVVLAAYGVDALLEKYRAFLATSGVAAGRETDAVPWMRRLLPFWAGLSVVLCFAMYAQEPLSRFLPENVNPAARLKGWEDLGRRVDELSRSLPNPGKVFIFSDQYDVTAQLAFYVPGQPVTFCADFGRRLNQYDFWPGPEDRQGWDAIFVRRKPFAEPPAELGRIFRGLGNPEAFRSTHRGGPGRVFGIQVVRGFTGEWPSISSGIY